MTEFSHIPILGSGSNFGQLASDLAIESFFSESRLSVLLAPIARTTAAGSAASSRSPEAAWQLLGRLRVRPGPGWTRSLNAVSARSVS